MKLFKNCPHEERKQCDDCPLLKQCMIKKTKRIIRRKLNQSGVKKVLVVLIALVILVCLISKCINKKDINIDKNDEKLKVVTNVANVDESYMNVNVENKKQACLLSETKKVATNKKPKDKANVVKEQTKATKAKQQKNVEKAIISSDGPSDEYYYHINDYDKKIIEKLVYQESRGEILEGKVAVAAVALNRYVSNDSKFDTTSIESVVTQKYQFADISNVTERQLSTVPECKQAVEMALKGWDPTRKKFSDGAKYFYEPTLVQGYQKEIREGINKLQIGNHNFHNDFND